MLKKGNVGPTGVKLPNPDLLLLSYTGCFTFLKWFELLREEYDCPVAMLHVPYLAERTHSSAPCRLRRRAVADRGHPETGAGQRPALRRGATCEMLALSAQAEDDFVWVLESAKNEPSPIDAYFGGVYYIGPIFTAFRGTTTESSTTACCAKSLRSAIGWVWPVTPEGTMERQRYRLVVEGPPNWTSFREFWKMFYDEGAVVVASSYTKVGGLYDRGFRHDPHRAARKAWRNTASAATPTSDSRRASNCSSATFATTVLTVS